MKQKTLKFKVSIGEVFIQDVENGIVNFGIANQRKIVRSADESLKNVQLSSQNNADSRVNQNG